MQPGALEQSYVMAELRRGGPGGERHVTRRLAAGVACGLPVDVEGACDCAEHDEHEEQREVDPQRQGAGASMQFAAPGHARVYRPELPGN